MVSKVHPSRCSLIQNDMCMLILTKLQRGQKFETKLCHTLRGIRFRGIYQNDNLFKNITVNPPGQYADNAKHVGDHLHTGLLTSWPQWVLKFDRVVGGLDQTDVLVTYQYTKGYMLLSKIFSTKWVF